MYITRKNLPSTTTSDVSVLENGCLLTLLWKLGALSGNDLNNLNATQFSLSFIRKDIIVPAFDRCCVGQVYWGGRDVLWRNQSCLRNGVEEEPGLIYKHLNK